MLTVLLHRAVMGMGPTLLGVLCCNVVSLSLAFKIKKKFFFYGVGVEVGGIDRGQAFVVLLEVT